MERLWLRNGRLLDLSTGREHAADVLVSEGQLTAVGPHLVPDGPCQEIDADGEYIVPGLIDLHAHVFDGVGESANADSVCLRRGTTVAVDAGTSGAATVDAFRGVAQTCRTDVVAGLNLATIGLADTSAGELLLGPYLNPDAAVAAARRHAGFVVGFKARLSTYAAGSGARRVLRAAREVGEELSLPVMVHIGDTAEPLEDLIGLLRPGDVVTHALTGRNHGILRADGTVHPAIWDAQRAGIVFDAARGRNHLSFPVLSRAAEQGFLPDTLSTDMSLPMATDPKYGLATIGTDPLAHGVPLHETLARMTVRPGRVIGRHVAASLAPGQSADLTLIALEQRTVVLEDVDGRRLCAEQSLVPKATVRSGIYRDTGNTAAHG